MTLNQLTIQLDALRQQALRIDGAITLLTQLIEQMEQETRSAEVKDDAHGSV